MTQVSGLRLKLQLIAQARSHSKTLEFQMLGREMLPCFVSWQGVALVLPVDKPATPPKKAQLSVILVGGADLCCAMLRFVTWWS